MGYVGRSATVALQIMLGGRRAEWHVNVAVPVQINRVFHLVFYEEFLEL